jgi:surface protein
MSFMFWEASTFEGGDLGLWDALSRVSDMTYMFEATAFDGDLSLWDTSSVTSMKSMFEGASSFNGDLSFWNVSKVSDMSYMFWMECCILRRRRLG